MSKYDTQLHCIAGAGPLEFTGRQMSLRRREGRRRRLITGLDRNDKDWIDDEADKNHV